MFLKPSSAMQFQSYVIGLADVLGEHQFPRNTQWVKAANIVREDAVHYTTMKRVISGIYKSNSCSKPTDPVDLYNILNFVGELHYELQQEISPDIEVLQLVNHIGEISVSMFSTNNEFICK